MNKLREILYKYETKRPEIVFEWKDAESEAEGWIVINSLRGGAAGGGTRMRKGLDKREVESLAKTMEIKFTVSGPPIGGAKSGINFDPNDPRKKEVLKRWFKAVVPLLKNYYGTGGDLNIDEIHEVIPFTMDLGLLHPQEGVVNGHLKVDKEGKVKRISQLRHGVSKIIESERYSPSLEKKYLVADMITGYGVSESVLHFYNIYGGTLKGKRVIIQGWGNVGAAAAFYLTQQGALVTGIIDRNGGLIKPEGMNHEEITELFINKTGNALQEKNLIPFEKINKEIWNVGAEVFIPAAASRLVTEEQVEAMIKGGLKVIACGANVPFADKEIFFGPIGEYTDSKISLIPDFISNCGMARVFAYLMGNDILMTDDAIFGDTSTVIKNAIQKVYAKNPSETNIAMTAFEIALNQSFNMWHSILGRTFLDNTVEDILWFFGIILAGFILKRAIAKILTAFVFRFLKKYSTGVSSEKLFILLKKPLDVFIILITFYIALQHVDFPPSWKMTPKENFGVQMVVFRAYQAAIIFSLTWIVLRIVDFFGLIMLHKASRTSSREDDQLVAFLKESIKVVVFIFSIFFMLGTVFNLNIASLIAGLGIGGLAVALAAKETLENLIGSFTIFLDKPFLIGDHVEIGNISGNVEKIGFRSTRIRTNEKSFVTVPNKKMVDSELNNLSLRTYRTVKFNFGITYTTPSEKIKLIVSDIQLMLDQHPILFHEESKARLLELGSNSLNIMVQYLITVVDWKTYIDTREEINFKIIEIVNRHNSSFIYPTNTLVLQKTDAPLQ